MEGRHVASAHGFERELPELREDVDPQEESIVPERGGLLPHLRVLGEVAVGELGDADRLPFLVAHGRGIDPLRNAPERGPRAPARLVHGEHPVRSEQHPSRAAPHAVLHEVGAPAARVDAHAEARKIVVPLEVLAIRRDRQRLDASLGEPHDFAPNQQLYQQAVPEAFRKQLDANRSVAVRSRARNRNRPNWPIGSRTRGFCVVLRSRFTIVRRGVGAVS